MKLNTKDDMFVKPLNEDLAIEKVIYANNNRELNSFMKY